jgi:hypothetical protein
MPPHSGLLGREVELEATQQFPLAVERGGEDAARHAVAFETGKPALDLIPPTAVGRPITSRYARMRGELGLVGLRLPSGQVALSEVNGLPRRHARDHLIEERQELRTRVARCRLPFQVPGRHVQRRLHRDRVKRLYSTVSFCTAPARAVGPGWRDRGPERRVSHQRRRPASSSAAPRRLRSYH